jgi:hypothetical protein
MSRTLRPLAALAMLALISAGCGGTRSGGGTSTGGPAGIDLGDSKGVVAWAVPGSRLGQ